MATIGARLKKIRDITGLSQADFGALFGVSRSTQVNYEGDKRPPDSNYLAALHEAGHDITYIVTGQLQSDALSAEEAALVHMFRQVDSERQAVVMATLRLMVPRTSHIGKDAAELTTIHDRAPDFRVEDGQPD
ncbi:MAG: helix-turn-helix transcriptional regulator [Sphingobium sp.]|uniref:helix-turn-helix domain-containing protein n=1 Tax=Sphingobium sp. TaxID=1912891 RepID=UPI003BAEE877